jgi:hypothetical protein
MKSGVWDWLVRQWQWPAAALVAATVLLCLLPLVVASYGLAITLIYLQLPAYMIHQGEEHLGDRFRMYANQTLGNGREVLTRAATFWINSLGVWLVDLLAIYAAVLLGPWAGLTAAYLALVNAILHMGGAVARRESNPGLVTAVFLFLPLGATCLWATAADTTWIAHAIGLGVAVAVHLIIVGYVLLQRGANPSAA